MWIFFDTTSKLDKYFLRGYSVEPETVSLNFWYSMTSKSMAPLDTLGGSSTHAEFCKLMKVAGAVHNSNGPRGILPSTTLTGVRKGFLLISHFVTQNINEMCTRFQDVIKVLVLQLLRGHS